MDLLLLVLVIEEFQLIHELELGLLEVFLHGLALLRRHRSHSLMVPWRCLQKDVRDNCEPVHLIALCYLLVR